MNISKSLQYSEVEGLAQLQWWAVCLADAERQAHECYSVAADTDKLSERLKALSEADVHLKRATLYERQINRVVNEEGMCLLMLWATQELDHNKPVTLEGPESSNTTE